MDVGRTHFNFSVRQQAGLREMHDVNEFAMTRAGSSFTRRVHQQLRFSIAGIAQLGEQQTEVLEVACSIHAPGTYIELVAFLLF